MAKKEILVDIRVKDKQLKQAIEYAKTLANLLSGESIDSDKLNKQLDTALKNIETLKNAETKRSEKKLAFGIKEFKQSKLELQKQKALIQEEKKRASEQDRARRKELAAAEKAAKKLQEEEDAVNKNVESYEDLAKQTAVLTKRRKQLNLTTDEGQAEFKRLTDILEDNNAQLKEMDGQIGNFQRNVGDYKNQLKGLAPAVGRVGDALDALKANPIIFLIGAVVGLVATLGKAFSKTERGQKAMAKITGVLKAGMTLLVMVADKLATGLVKLFTEPVALMKDFGTAISSFILSKFEAAKTAVFSLGSAFGKFFKGDFSGAVDSLKEFGKAALDLTPVGAVKKAVNGIGQVVDAVDDMVTAYAALEVAKQNQLKADRDLEISIAKQSVSIARLTQIRDDDTISLTANKKAADELAKAQERSSKDAVKGAKARLDLINRELALKNKAGEIDNELLDRQKDAIIELTNAESEYSQQVADNAERRRKIESDQAELRLDALIDNTNATLTANERIINSDATTAEERARLVEENKALVEKSLTDQVAVLQEFATEQIDINDLLATKDAALLDEKLKKLGLSEILTTRQLEVLREQATLQQDLIDLEKDANEKSYDQSFAAFERRQELAKLEFEATKQTEADKAAFELNQEREKLQAELDLKDEFGVLFAENERELLEAQVAANEKALLLLTTTSKKKEDLSKAEANAVGEATNAIVEAFGEQSAAGKAAGIVQKGQTISRATLAIGEGLAQSAKIGFPQNILTIAGMAAQAATIYSTIKKVKFERGGLLHGASHAQGGIDIGNNQEAEGGEYIVNKKSTAQFLPFLDKINTFNGWGDGSGGSKEIFARGGVTAAQDVATDRTAVQVEKVFVPVLNVSDTLDVVADISQEVEIQQGF